MEYDGLIVPQADLIERREQLIRWGKMLLGRMKFQPFQAKLRKGVLQLLCRCGGMRIHAGKADEFPGTQPHKVCNLAVCDKCATAALRQRKRKKKQLIYSGFRHIRIPLPKTKGFGFIKSHLLRVTPVLFFSEIQLLYECRMDVGVNQQLASASSPRDQRWTRPERRRQRPVPCIFRPTSHAELRS